MDTGQPVVESPDATTSGHHNSSTLLDAAALALLMLFGAVGTAGAISDNSYFTQMSNGRFALNSDRWPQVDVWTDSPGRWIAPGRLSSLFFAVADSTTSGALGRILATAAICGTVVLLWQMLSSFTPSPRAGIIALFMLGEMAFLSQRAQTTGLFLFCAVLYLISMRSPKALMAFAPVFALWVNWHGSWSLGLAVFVAACGMNRWFRPGLAAVAATVGGALVSPYGLDLLFVPLDHIGKSNLQYIIEWRRPGLTELHTVAFAAMWALALWFVARRWSRLRTDTRLLALGFAVVFLVAGFSAQRNIMFALPLAVWVIGEAHRPRGLAGGSAPGFPMPALTAQAASAVVVVLTVLIVVTPSYSFPLAPAGLVESIPDGRTVLTDLDTGSFMQVIRGPEVQLFVDDRGEIHSEEKFRLWDEFRGGEASAVDDMNVDTVLWITENEAIESLVDGGDWSLVGTESLPNGLEMALLFRS